ncbi:hypothetical protein O276_22 [Enterobacteria phage O276]|uniref:Lambda-like tail fibre protein N-terminal domain-containing protein n=1 Tax=Enterobacteria phage O276 TaxID=2282412 RepID=A0A346FJ86_9CAUD|nr:hypothetical protein H3V33_gp22 [Enterobacteria phage O276]AXN58041.1 hypothetical protein O276_22 [Enterobacteria phage O276]
MNMAVKISGVLKDGTGKPVQNCTIQLKARRNSTTVVVNTVGSENPNEAIGICYFGSVSCITPKNIFICLIFKCCID